MKITISPSKTGLLAIGLAAVLVLDGLLLAQRFLFAGPSQSESGPIDTLLNTSSNSNAQPSPNESPGSETVGLTIVAQLAAAKLREQELLDKLVDAQQRIQPDFATLKQIAWTQLEEERDELARTNPYYNDAVNSTADLARRILETNMRQFALFLDQAGIDRGSQLEILQALEEREQLNSELTADAMAGNIQASEFFERRDTRTDKQILQDYISQEQTAAFVALQEKFRDANTRAQNAMQITTQTRGMSASGRDLLIETYTNLGGYSAGTLPKPREALVGKMSPDDMVQVEIFIETRQINVDRNSKR